MDKTFELSTFAGVNTWRNYLRDVSYKVEKRRLRRKKVSTTPSMYTPRIRQKEPQASEDEKAKLKKAKHKAQKGSNDKKQQMVTGGAKYDIKSWKT